METDRTDARLKRLFASLPRETAPPDFEERLSRRIASSAGRPDAAAWWQPYLVPAMALLVVGIAASVFYLSRIRTEGEFQIPESDIIEGSGDRSPDTAGSIVRPPGPAPGPGMKQEPAPVIAEPKSAPRDAVRQPVVSPQPPARTAPRQQKGQENAPPAFSPPPAQKAREADARARTAPGRLLKEELPPDSGAKADSLGRRDTTSRDSLPAPADSTRDSTADSLGVPAGADSSGGPPHY